MWTEYWEDRGNPWDYDPGPPRNRRWPRLFAQTPNYRGIGKEVNGREEFRWHFGPMFYRGRLGDNQIKVMIVGQEGAQDESLAHRSFTGGTGARMQNLLNHIGVTQSYLFLNTFVYPIFGQYDGDLRPLAQHPASPIVKHRHEVFDYVVARNDLMLVIAVGTAAKESIATWVESHGGTARPSALHEADASVISPNLRIVGVLHPGGAGKGGSVTRIISSFKSAIRRIDRWASDDASWLPVDSGGTRSSAASYKYRSAPIPFRDFAYGTAWRLGRGGTSSNRRDRQQSIQIFSKDGKYNNKGHRISYRGDASGSREGYAADTGDLAYEPPKRRYRDFDRGPEAKFAALLQGGKAGFPWPDFNDFGLKCHASFGTGPIYRGRLDRPSILVLADQQSQDDLFTGRALTGDAGQHLQAFLASAGTTKSYAVLRVLPVDVLDDNEAKVRDAVDSDEVRALYAEVIRRSRPKVVVVMGPLAKRLESHVVPDRTPVVRMRAHNQSGVNADWRRALRELKDLTYRKDSRRPSFDYHGERMQIPRIDLPFGTLRWQGSSGDRGLQPRKGRSPSYDYYKFVMPDWADNLDPAPLSRAEQAAADALKAL